MSKPTREPPEGVYGFLLTIRVLAAFAVRWPEHPASLRVLAVLAEYANQDGLCRVSRFTLADRLGMTRQGIQRHLKLLRNVGFIDYETGNGALSTFTLHTDDAEDLREGREGQDAVDAGRKQRRARRREQRHTTAPPKRQVQPNEVAPVSRNAKSAPSCATRLGENRQVQPNEVAGGATSEVAAGATSGDCTGCNVIRLHEETSFRTTEESSEREGAAAPRAADAAAALAPQFSPGETVEHGKLGYGTVIAQEEHGGWVVTVAFKNGSTQRVMATSIDRVFRT
jgi:hypothetical protein